MSTARLGIYSELELQAARELVRELVRAVRGYRLYEGNHPTLAEMLLALRKKWDAATAGGPISLRLTEREVLLDEASVYKAASAGEMIPSVLFDHGVVGFVFKRGLAPEEAERLVGVLGADPEQLPDIASLLWEADLNHLQILLDADEIDGEADAESPEDFAMQVATLGEEGDPPAPPPLDGEAADLAQMLAQHAQAGGAAVALTGPDADAVRRLVAEDDHAGTLRHAARVIHSVARTECTAHEAGCVEKVLRSVIASLAAAGDLAGATETLERARRMAASSDPREMRAGEATLAAFSEPAALTVFLHALNRVERIEARALAECFAHLDPSAAGLVAGWLLETRHPLAVTQAIRVFGQAAVEALVPLYRGREGRGRDRIAPALLELGTPEALAAVAAEFRTLAEGHRFQLVQVAERSDERALRKILVEALDDSAQRIRMAATAAIRKSEAAELAPFVAQTLANGTLGSRTNEECDAFFAMVARVGDEAVAREIAVYCLPRTFTQRFRAPSPLQIACIHALRRMRGPGPRAVADEVRAKGPKSVREILDDPLADL